MKDFKFKISAAVLGFLLATLCAFLLQPLIVEAAGHIGLTNVKQELRTLTFTRIFSTVALTDATEGTDGVISVMVIEDLEEADVTDSDPDMLPYPCKLDAYFIDDATTADTLECDCVTIEGRNQFGIAITDTIGTCATDGALDESADPYEGSKVFEIVTTATADDCDGSTDAGDQIVLRCSGEIGLPAAITSEAAILQFCLYDLSATNLLCFENGDITTDLDNYSVELDGLDGAGDPDNGDVLFVRLRYPAGK